MVQNALLICGVLSSLLYVATDILGGMQYEGYSFTSQAISELGAIGAPSKPLLDVLMLVYAALLFAFGAGVWRSAGQKRPLRVVGGLLVTIAINGFLWAFFPMHMRGAEPTLTDTMHVIHAAVASVLILVAMGFGAAAFGKRFRLYSIGTILMLLVTGALLSLDAQRMQANLPTPWVGVTERINVYGYLLWVAVLAIILSGEYRRGAFRQGENHAGD